MDIVGNLTYTSNHRNYILSLDNNITKKHMGVQYTYHTYITVVKKKNEEEKTNTNNSRLVLVNGYSHSRGIIYIIHDRGAVTPK